MTYKTTKKTAEAKKGPIYEIRVSGCKVAIWENQTEKGTRHNDCVQPIGIFEYVRTGSPVAHFTCVAQGTQAFGDNSNEEE